MPKTLSGRYNAARYVIEDENGEEVYEAGNSPYESQGYIGSKDGVGLEVMKNYCTSTLVEMCREKNSENGGVEQMGNE